MSTLKRFNLLGIAALLVACSGDSTGPGSDNFSGRWVLTDTVGIGGRGPATGATLTISTSTNRPFTLQWPAWAGEWLGLACPPCQQSGVWIALDGTVNGEPGWTIELDNTGPPAWSGAIVPINGEGDRLLLGDGTISVYFQKQ